VDLSEAFVLDLSRCLHCLLDLQDAAQAAAVSLHIAGASPEWRADSLPLGCLIC
jgi:hypothetical protein